MDEEKRIELQKKLAILCKEYGLENSAFCANTIEEPILFCGLFGDEKPQRMDKFILTTMNIGRLWQSAREKVKGNLDKFENHW